MAHEPVPRGAAGTLIGILVASAGVAAARPTVAEGRLVLDWNAPAECPDAEYVKRRVTEALGDVPMPTDVLLRARGDVSAEGGGWRVRLAITSGPSSGYRVVVAETCRSLADATALILALALEGEAPATPRALDGSPDDLESDAAAAGPATASTDATDAAPAPRSDGGALGDSPPQPPATLESRAESEGQPPTESEADRSGESIAPPPNATIASPTKLVLGLSLVADLGSLPAPASGLEGSLGLRPAFAPWLRAEVGAALWSSESKTFPQTQSGQFQLRSFEAMACVVFPAGPTDLGACAGAELAWMLANGLYETVTRRSDEATWPVLRADAAIAYRLSSWLWVRGRLGTGVNVDRPDYVALSVMPAASARIFQPSLFVGRAALGLEWRF